MSKKCKFVNFSTPGSGGGTSTSTGDGEVSSQSSSLQTDASINWELCVLCQGPNTDELQCPARSLRQDVGAGYRSLAEDLTRLHELGELPPNLNLAIIDNGQGLASSLFANKAQWHKSCRAKYNKTKIMRAEKRKLSEETVLKDVDSSCRYMRSKSDTGKEHDVCFFCDEDAGLEGLHEATTLERVDQSVRNSAYLLQDSKLLAKLSAGDMVALEAKYHLHCLASLYNRSRAVKDKMEPRSDDKAALHSIVFAELVSYVDDARTDTSVAPVFKLAELANLYTSRLEQLGFKPNQRIHTTRLKEKLLSHFPDLKAHNQGRDVLLMFDQDIGDAMRKACEQDNDSDAIHLAKAAQIVRREMFAGQTSFTGSFNVKCQESVPETLIALIRMILEGPNIKDQGDMPAIQEALTISQLLVFNSVKHARHAGTKTQSVRHSQSQETPLTVYTGLLLHAETRKRDLVDKFHDLGMSVSYDRVLRITAGLANAVCQQYEKKGIVSPPQLRAGLFTTSAVDNIDHNPSSTTATGSFHGTAISITQHPTVHFEGTDQEVISIDDESDTLKKTVDPLPAYYTEVPPVMLRNNYPNVPKREGPMAGDRQLLNVSLQDERQWLDCTMQNLKEEWAPDKGFVSWAAYHANLHPTVDRPKSLSALLPLFHDNAHSAAMIRHSMNLVKQVVQELNPGQVPVLTCDQPLYAITKQIQWTWPESHGEDHFVILLGGLHIEMAFMKVAGDWLEDSGWTEALVQADVAGSGTADSFLRASHVSRTRNAHQVTAACLFILQHRAYDMYTESNADVHEQLDFDQWCKKQEDSHPQFKYWSIVLELELHILMYVRSLRESNFKLYIDALTELVPWCFALDHTNYARWLSVHIRDMAGLSDTHQAIEAEFTAGHFTIHKTGNAFSAIAIDHAHEQENANVKGEGGAIGLTENAAALRRWMVAGPEVSRVIREFEQHKGEQKYPHRHHDEQPAIQTRYLQQVASLVCVYEEMGNPFTEESEDLISLHDKNIADPAVAQTVKKVKTLGQQQYGKFVEECFIKGTKTVKETISRNKLPLFSRPPVKHVDKGKLQLASAKTDCALFSKLYIGCQSRDGNLDDFFSHENQKYPPALSDAGKLRLGSKSDLLSCLKGEHQDRPNVSATIVDGAVIVQMLEPRTSKTFEDYAKEIFLPHIRYQLQHIHRLDIVWDEYLKDSLKASTREKRGKGTRKRVLSSAPVPRNWRDFLRVDDNKKELFHFLSQHVSQLEIEKDVCATDGQGVVCSKNTQLDVAFLAPCLHEEADTRIFVHAADAARNGHRTLLVRTVDTDVVVIAIALVGRMNVDELWIAFGSGKSFRYLAVHEIANSLGPERSSALPFFHSFTGCDTVSAFAWHGKKTAWDVWASFPEVSKTFAYLSAMPDEVSPAELKTVERFVILLYDRTSDCVDVNSARKNQFTKKGRSIDRIPPTQAALEQHIKRAIYQAGYVWRQSLVLDPILPCPSNWGWIRDRNNSWQPLWSVLPEAAKSCFELIHCGCKKGCKRQCKCVKAGLVCTALCACDGQGQVNQ